MEQTPLSIFFQSTRPDEHKNNVAAGCYFPNINFCSFLFLSKSSWLQVHFWLKETVTFEENITSFQYAHKYKTSIHFLRWNIDGEKQKSIANQF